MTPDTDTEETKARARAARYALPAMLGVCRLPRKLIAHTLTPTNLMTLGFLRERGTNYPTMTELAAAFRVSSAAITSNVDHLDRLQYVRRLTNSNDRRSYFIALTEKGEGVMEELVAELADEIKSLLLAGF